ncbi:hypothetical protein Tco_0300589 [Tanacetum coccineum]
MSHCLTYLLLNQVRNLLSNNLTLPQALPLRLTKHLHITRCSGFYPREPTGRFLEDHSSNDESLSGNEDDMTLQNVYDLCISLCQQVSDQAKEIKLLKAKITKLKKKREAKPVQHIIKII